MAYRTLLLQVHGPRRLQACPDECGHPQKEGSSPTWTNPRDSVTVTAPGRKSKKEEERNRLRPSCWMGGHCATQDLNNRVVVTQSQRAPRPTGAPAGPVPAPELPQAVSCRQIPLPEPRRERASGRVRGAAFPLFTLILGGTDVLFHMDSFPR